MARIVFRSFGLGACLPLGEVDHHWLYILDVVPYLASILSPVHMFDNFCSFVLIKVIMGINLVSYATRRRAGMEAREAADVVNDFGRDPIGEGPEERVSHIHIIFPTDPHSVHSTIRSTIGS